MLLNKLGDLYEEIRDLNGAGEQNSVTAERMVLVPANGQMTLDRDRCYQFHALFFRRNFFAQKTMAALSTMTHRYLSNSFPSSFPYSLSSLTPHDLTSDRAFYVQPRFVNHIDDHAISQLSQYYSDNLPRSQSSSSAIPRILDICSSWVSHIPLGSTCKNPSVGEIGMEVVGIGMNEAELKANPILSGWVAHDLNQTPSFAASLGSGLQKGKARDDSKGNKANASYDAVICNVSIDYLTRPLEIMQSIANVLRPGGSAYMAVSNRCFPTKVSPPISPGSHIIKLVLTLAM